MSDWNYLNRYRVRDGMWASDPADGCNGYFCLMIGGEKVKVIASDGEGWQHVSVSLADKPSVVPNYKTMCEVAEFARTLERELAMAGEIVPTLNRKLGELEQQRSECQSENTELRRFKAAALTLTTLASVQLAMSKDKS